MPQKTHARYGDPTNNIKQAVGLFATNMQRNSTLARLTGKMPDSESSAGDTIRKQTSSGMPIVRAQDLGKKTGDEVTFHLVNPVGAKPIMGSAYAEGRGTGMGLSEDRLRVDQARFPVSAGDVMTNIRSPADFRQLARPIAQSLMDRYVDQTLITHLSGARGFHNNIEWVVPTENDPDFQKILINKVRAPSANRHYVADNGAIIPFTSAVSAGQLDITSTDVLNMSVIDAIRTTMEQIPLPPPAVIFEGDRAATDSPLRVLLVTPAQYHAFATDPAFRQFQASALARSQQAKQNPLFLGEAGLWNGVLIVKQPRPIRFYAGDTIHYCADKSSEEESDVVVPAAFGTTFAVDRAILLGGQAVAEALAASWHSGIPFFWSEKELDHGDKVELLIGAIRGVSKIRYEVDTGAGKEFTDYGTIAIDTAVPIIGARQ
jgi:N4-gp56 family major capsid protein